VFCKRGWGGELNWVGREGRGGGISWPGERGGFEELQEEWIGWGSVNKTTSQNLWPRNNSN